MIINKIGEQKEIIYFYTYDSEWNQGRVFPLGKKEVRVHRVLNTRTRQVGCTSLELFQDTMDVVDLDGRIFLVEDALFGDKERRVGIPYGFRPALLFPRTCPYCGK